MDTEPVIEKLHQYSNLVVNALAVNKIVLFGSYAKGNWTEDSDIDLAIYVDSNSDDFLQLSAKLSKLTRNIDNRIEPILLEEKNDRSGFMADINKHCIVIYQRTEFSPQV